MIVTASRIVLGIIFVLPHWSRATSAVLRGTNNKADEHTGLSAFGKDPAITTVMDKTACVTLEVYGKDQSCSGDLVETESLNTYEEPGGPCEHDHTMPSFISAKDRYCNLSDGTFHQTVYVGSSKCSKSFIHHLIPPHKQVFHENDCLNGLKLISCKAGPCDNTSIVEN